ncbi:hypothetical protein NQZ68_029254 [Dissostichus eleginoides]|nr:hypothetical protein NQZ68_029254 [Dissostichus eleginoides]
MRTEGTPGHSFRVMCLVRELWLVPAASEPCSELACKKIQDPNWLETILTDDSLDVGKWKKLLQQMTDADMAINALDSAAPPPPEQSTVVKKEKEKLLPLLPLKLDTPSPPTEKKKKKIKSVDVPETPARSVSDRNHPDTLRGRQPQREKEILQES